MKQTIVNKLKAQGVSKLTSADKKVIETFVKLEGVMVTEDLIEQAVKGVMSSVKRAKVEATEKALKPIVEAFALLPDDYVLCGELLDVVMAKMPKTTKRSVGVKYPIVINGKVFSTWADVMRNVKYDNVALWKLTTEGSKFESYPKHGFNAKTQIGQLAVIRNGGWDVYPIGGDEYVKYDAAHADNHKEGVCDVKDVLTDYNGNQATVITMGAAFTI